MEPQVIQKSLQPSGVHTNRPLTNISLAYMQSTSNFVANRVFPTVSVQKQSDIFYRFKRDQWNRNEMKMRAPATESAGGSYDVDTVPYYVPVYAVHMDVSDQVRANSDEQIDPDVGATQWVTQKGLLFREVAWANAYFKAGVWDREKTGVAAAPTTNQFLQWNDAASEPAKDIKNARDEMLQATGILPNVLVLGHQAYTALTENDSVMDRVKYGQTPGSPALVTKNVLAQIFEVDRVEVLSAIVNTSAQAESNTFIAGPKSAGLYYAAPSPGLMVPSAGYTFAWTGYLGANAEGGSISRFRMDLIRSDRVELELAFAANVVATDLAVFFKTVIA